MSQLSAIPRVDKSRPSSSLRLPLALSWAAPLHVVALVILSVALFAGPFIRLVELRESNVYHHIEAARQIAETHVLYPGHFLYHVLTVAAHGMVPLSWLQANLVVLLAMRSLLAVIVWGLVWRSLGARNTSIDGLLAIALTLALMFASAVSFVTWGQGNYYLGYVVPTVYVSQTMVVLQPLALLTFCAVIRVLDAPRPGPSWRDVLAMAVLTALSVLAKPSFAMVLLPAAATLLLLRRQLVAVVPIRRVGVLLVPGRWCKDVKSVLTLAMGLVIPALVAIAWVYVSTYLNYQQLDVSEGSGTQIAPFKVMAYLQSHYVSDENVPFWLALKLALSLLFPAAVAIAYFPHVRHDTRFQLAWLQLALGLVFMYLFAEHPRFAAGNFTWSAQIALFILFVVSALVLCEQSLRGARSLWRAVVASPAVFLCYATLILHVVAGYGLYMHPDVH